MRIYRTGGSAFEAGPFILPEFHKAAHTPEFFRRVKRKLKSSAAAPLRRAAAPGCCRLETVIQENFLHKEAIQIN